MTEKCPFLAKNPPLWILNQNFSYIFLFSNPFCTCVPNFKHIPYIKVKLWPYLCRKYSDFDWKMLRFTQKSAIMDFFQIFFLTSKILQQSGQIRTKSKSIPPFYPQLWSKVLVILKKCHFSSIFVLFYNIPPLLSSTRQNWKLKLHTCSVYISHAKFQTVFRKYLVRRIRFVKDVRSNFHKNWRNSLQIRHYGFQIWNFFTNSYFLIHSSHNCQISDRSYP